MVADRVRLTAQPGRQWWREPTALELKNGLRVLFVEREASPIFEARLVLSGGFAADPKRRSGLAAFAAAMFSEGLVRRGSTPLRSTLPSLGAQICGEVLPDGAAIGISALNNNFADALSVYLGALSHPEWKNEDFELLREKRLAVIARERLDPFALALRALPPRLYGRGHRYGRPFTGSGREPDVATLTGDDLHSYYAGNLAPQSTTLIVAGACASADLLTRLEQTFGQSHDGAAADVKPAAVMLDTSSSILLVNRPGAPQTWLTMGLRTVARNSHQAEPLMIADTILGGIFTSRLNLSLREHKGWTYGVRSSLLDARPAGSWLIRTAVRTDSAVQAMGEIAGELKNLAGQRPPAHDEFVRAVAYLVARIPSAHESSAQIADGLAHLIIHGLDLSYWHKLANRLRSVSAEDVMETCRYILATAAPQWLVVGDAAKLVARLDDAGFREVKVIEPDSAGLP